MEQVLNIFREQIVAAAAAGTALCIRGGGSKDWYGEVPRGAVLDTRAYRGIIEYEPTELVITARCGTPLAEIEAALTQQNQMLAFEPPHFGTAATVGGVVAAGLSGPRRQAVGSLRDFVLGVVMMNGQGEVLHFGGQVMKNVAGYDVSRLLTGSLGTLGLLLEVSLKVLPKPFAETTVQLRMSQADAIRRVNTWGGQPLPVSASLWQDDMLTMRLSGALAAVAAARKLIGGEEVDGQQFWQAAREHTSSFYAGVDVDHPVWRLSVPSTAAPLDLPGQQCIEWSGAQRWLRTSATAATVRAVAASAGGHATLFRGGDKNVGAFHPLTPPVAAIHRNLKAGFDPQAIFNPGRLYPDL